MRKVRAQQMTAIALAARLSPNFTPRLAWMEFHGVFDVFRRWRTLCRPRSTRPPHAMPISAARLRRCRTSAGYRGHALE
jgi:hypothetical protein